MGQVDLNRAEVTLLSMGKRRVKRFNGDYADAITFAKHCKVTLSDGTEFFAELHLVPPDIYQSGTVNATEFVYENVFIEAYDVADKDAVLVHEKRGHI